MAAGAHRVLKLVEVLLLNVQVVKSLVDALHVVSLNLGSKARHYDEGLIKE
jgi:hypothetical protein